MPETAAVARRLLVDVHGLPAEIADGALREAGALASCLPGERMYRVVHALVKCGAIEGDGPVAKGAKALLVPWCGSILLNARVP